MLRHPHYYAVLLWVFVGLGLGTYQPLLTQLQAQVPIQTTPTSGALVMIPHLNASRKGVLVKMIPTKLISMAM